MKFIAWAPAVFPLLLVVLKFAVLWYIRYPKGDEMVFSPRCPSNDRTARSANISHIFEAIIFAAISYDVFVIYYKARQCILSSVLASFWEPIAGCGFLIVHLTFYLVCQGLIRQMDIIKYRERRTPVSQMIWGGALTLISWFPIVALIGLQLSP